jgi:hypothetical protein
MAQSHVLSGLIDKRAELAGRIEAAQTELRLLLITLDNLDATIRLFDPNIDLDEVRPKALPARNTAFRGEVARLVLTCLRKAGAPLPLNEITLHVMTGRMLNTDDKPLMRVLSKRVGAALRHNRHKGLVASIIGPNGAMLWEIARDKKPG